MDCSGNNTVFNSRRMRMIEQGFANYTILKENSWFDRECKEKIEGQLRVLRFEGYKWWERTNIMDFGEFLTRPEFTWCIDGPTGRMKVHGPQTISPCLEPENWDILDNDEEELWDN